VFGKVIGGGMPLAAFGARRDVMKQLAPLGPVIRPAPCPAIRLQLHAAMATLREVRKPAVFRSPFEQHPLDARRPACQRKGGGRANGRRLRRWNVRLLLSRSFDEALPQNYAQVMATDKGALQPLLSTRCSIVACTLRRQCTRPVSSARRHTADDLRATASAALQALG